MVQQQSFYCNENKQEDQQVYWMSWYVTQKSRQQSLSPSFGSCSAARRERRVPFQGSAYRSSTEEDLPRKAQILPPQTELHHTEASILQCKHATFTGRLEH